VIRTGRLWVADEMVYYQSIMALLPEIHVNVGQLTFERIYQIFLPVIPGSTLVGGLMFAHPTSAHAVVAALDLGRYSRLAVLLSIVYIVGLLLYGFSVFVTGNCSVILSYLIGKKFPPKRQNETPSQSFIFRRVASEFLGNSLTPPPVQSLGSPFAGNDIEWQDFYNVLQDYVLRGFAVVPNEALLLFTYLEATGWALLYLYFRTALQGHWSIIVVSISVIFLGATFPTGSNYIYWKYDRLTAWDFIARLINEIRLREGASTTTQQ
jgi:hypothetical protein